MKIKVYDKFQFPFLFHYPYGTKYADIDISFTQWLNLKVNGIIPIFKAKPEGFVGETTFYIVKCSKHGYYFSFGQGYYNNDFPCPLCLEELFVRLG